MKKFQTLKWATAGVAGAAIAFAAGMGPASAQDDVLVGLITKTDNNPFFVKMREGAQAKADELGVKFQAFAGKFDGDNDGQVAAVETLIAAGAKGILITPSDTVGIVPTIQKARDAGILVIALDTPLDPIDSADATFATDNFRAGELIGEWAAKTLGPEKTATAKIAFLDALEAQPTVDAARDQGFMTGFGIDVKDPSRYLDEDDDRICGHQWGAGAEDGGRTGMETLLQKCPDINVVYTINEPTAAGAWEALKAIGKDDGSVLMTSVDGGCPGVENVKAGVIGATSMQFPLLMAALGVEAVAEYAKSGKVPEPTPGLDFFDTGVSLITDAPVDGVPSETSAEGLTKCWG
ncbi:sugar ABC transporter substrate-binding protein [Bauldia litoralis]|uniref:Fructose transport system substrate-binding protein n=1 Tax=Bauldia litoralis TaxID=665467 RepID=A0A1G6BPC7_9HYPH|nr:sugar ABC transporter substrate-binding protein [Bauldia litoralis]SDB22481.1 fructose transport system substrate-binding protein [Bauldia litoralis]